MKLVIQRVKNASVTIDNELFSSIEQGYLILFGVEKGDTKAQADWLANKVSVLRCFSDENGKMNLSVKDIGGRALVVSNFTLMANYAHGNRPDYLNSAPPAIANELYEFFKSELSSRIGECECGKFGADMRTEMSTDGPVTIVMDSAVLRK